MSYEGYQQCICANGHYFSRDAYFDNPCPFCGADPSWENSVDQTNCDDIGIIPMELLREHFLIADQQTSTCEHCQTTKVIAQATFHIPLPDETKPLQHFRLSDGSLKPLWQKK